MDSKNRTVTQIHSCLADMYYQLLALSGVHVHCAAATCVFIKIHPLLSIYPNTCSCISRYMNMHFRLCQVQDQAEFCQISHSARETAADNLQEVLTAAAGHGRLPRFDIIHDIRACLVDNCGGCPGAGQIVPSVVAPLHPFSTPFSVSDLCLSICFHPQPPNPHPLTQRPSFLSI